VSTKTPLSESDLAASAALLSELKPRIGVAIAESNGTNGVKVIAVSSKGSGESAGLRTGDTILTYNGTPIRGSADFGSFVEKTPVGSQVFVTIRRDGKEIDCNLRMNGSNFTLDQVGALYDATQLDNVARLRTSKAQVQAIAEVDDFLTEGTVGVANGRGFHSVKGNAKRFNSTLEVSSDSDSSDATVKAEQAAAAAALVAAKAAASAEAIAAATRAMEIADQKVKEKEAEAAADAAMVGDYEEEMKARALLDQAVPRLGLAIEESKPGAKAKKQNGVRVVGVVPNGSAAVAGVMVDDVIENFNNVVITASDVFSAEQRKVKVGDDMRFKISRKGKKIEVIVRMGARGYTLDQISKLRQLVANSSTGGVSVIKNKASAVKGAQTNFVKVGLDADGSVKTDFADAVDVNSMEADLYADKKQGASSARDEDSNFDVNSLEADLFKDKAQGSAARTQSRPLPSNPSPKGAVLAGRPLSAARPASASSFTSQRPKSAGSSSGRGALPSGPKI